MRMVALLSVQLCNHKVGMEDILTDIQSRTFKKQVVQELFSKLDSAIDEASELRDQEFVKDPTLRKALNIVEEFLRRSKRICYGGMAINAHLPPEQKFYDFSKVLPDYDFFTPNPEEDIQTLIQMLKEQGLEDAVARIGIHEGTTKIFVNFSGVADITHMEPWIYDSLKRHAIKENGIYYADADFLRMNMYLELSRPRGEVERWEKVYKRLLLLNSVKTPQTAECKGKDIKLTSLSHNLHEIILHYIINNKLIFSSADLKRIYSHPKITSAGFLNNSTHPILVSSENPDFHLNFLKQILQQSNPNLHLKSVYWKSKGEIVPELFGLVHEGRVLVLFLREQFCHAYNTIRIPKKGDLKISSLDTAITQFYSLSFVKGLEGFVPKSPRCFANELVDISRKTRDQNVESKFPYFPVSCQGHQPSKITLLREKAKRVASLKRKVKKMNTTRKKRHS